MTDDLVTELANRLSCSEYEVFEKAADEWNKTTAKDSFVVYIQYQHVPWWVRGYCRKRLQELQEM